MAIYEIEEKNWGFERGNVRTLHPGMRNSINTYAQKKCRLPLIIFRSGVKSLPREREVPKILGRATPPERTPLAPPVRIQVEPLNLYSFFMLFWENYSFTMQ